MLDSSIKVRKGEELNIVELGDYLNQKLDGFNKIKEVTQFPGGYSNLTYSIDTNIGEFVLRRPPIGANIKYAHDMGREFNVMSTLKPVFDKVPNPVLLCEDRGIIGSPFYMMERVKGIILRAKAPEGFELNKKKIREISEATIDNLVELHAIDIHKTGLINLGKPEGYVKRQVDGWIGRYYKSQTDDIKQMDQIAEWMQSSIPQEANSAFIHNDYKYDNLVLDAKDISKIKAVLDWEMATVGDPLMDLGTSVAYWVEDGENPAMTQFSLTSFKGNYSRREVLNRYALKSGRDVTDFLFYYVYASFKIGVIVQQIYQRYKKGLTQDPRFSGLIHLVKGFADNGANAIKYGRISDFK